VNKSTVIMIVIFVVILVAALVGVIYGVTTHTEAGFATASTPLTDGFVAPAYPHRPIAVCGRSYPQDTATDADRRALDGAIGTINDRLGFTLLENNYHGCVMSVTLGAPQDVSTASRHTDPGGTSGVCPTGCCIETINTGTSELTSLSLEHEIGHCLGLAHDDYPMSIMYPALAPTPEGAYPPRISDSDRDLLRSTYSSR